MRKKRRKRESSIVFKKIMPIQTTTTLITMELKGRQHIDRICSICLKAYVSLTQETFKLVLEDEIIRECLQKALKSERTLSWSEMLEAESLSTLTYRLMVRVVNSRPIIIFSWKNIAEKGLLIAKDRFQI